VTYRALYQRANGRPQDRPGNQHIRGLLDHLATLTRNDLTSREDARSEAVREFWHGTGRADARIPVHDASMAARLRPATIAGRSSELWGQSGYCRAVPRISAFYGVVIYMYWNERDHPVVHFHAYHAGRRASVSMNGDVLAGSLEPRALQFVREWASLRREEILANWERARRNEPLIGIEPLP